jgi:hypothetical protein
MDQNDEETEGEDRPRPPVTLPEPEDREKLTPPPTEVLGVWFIAAAGALAVVLGLVAAMAYFALG